jgi:ribosomal protein S18 acetylase RimI-like enzyme
VADIVVGLADRGSAAELTALHRAVARFAYADIFPPEAPPPTYEEDLARWQDWLGPDWEQGRRAHVALTGPTLVGVVLAGPDPDDPRLGHIARLYVDPSCWGVGVGTLLYRAAVADLTEREFPAATLWVLEANRRARDWYERLGWRTTGSASRSMHRRASTTSSPGSTSAGRSQTLGEEVQDDLGAHAPMHW